MINDGTKNSIYNIVEKMLGKEIQKRKYLRKKERMDDP